MKFSSPLLVRPSWLAVAGFSAWCFSAHAADQPQWGQAWSRNMVSAEKGLADSFDPKTGQHIKWSARLGTQAHSTPIVAGGRVYIGTNNGDPRDPADQNDRGVLMCFDEATGRFLWQLLVPKREEDPYLDWPKMGMSSPVTVEGDRVYLVNNRGEVMCLDPRDTSQPLKPGNPSAASTAPKVLWQFDLTKGAGIWSHDAAHSSILVLGDYLYLNSGTGVDNTHKRIRTPDAPGLVVIDKRTGRLVARDREQVAPETFHANWSAPSLGRVNGRPLIAFAGGNGILYGFEPWKGGDEGASPASLTRVWRFDFDPGAPRTNVHRFNSNRRESPSNFYGMPVFLRDRIYLAGGGDLFWGKNEAWLKCIDATRTGDTTTNALIWSAPLQKHVLSTPAIVDGLVFIADCGRRFHCLDAETGRPIWDHEIAGEVWASPLVADGKVYLGTRSGAFYIFAANREKKLISSLELGDPISATVTAANGVLYLATMTHLYAIR